MVKRGTFGSRFGVIAAVCGSVVGLGNIWRFPYIAGENGGGAFLFVYICVSLLIAVPILLAELAIGRSTNSNAYRSFKKLSPTKRSLWPGIGLMGVITAFLIMSFYMVISGWGVEFLMQSCVDGFNGMSADDIQHYFAEFTACGWKPILWMVVFIVANYLISILGVEKGIERCSKVLMPTMVILLLVLIVNSLMQPRAIEGVKFLLHPDFSKIDVNVVLQAIGQAFFSLSLGMGAMITYGSYIKEDVNLFKTAATVAISDGFIALLCGLVIFPTVFSFGINPTSGPELVFITLPNIFQQMTGGYLVSILFFFIVIIAAITSSISLMEVVTAYVIEEFKMSRIKAVTLTSIVVALTATLCALSMMPDSTLIIGGRNLLDFFDMLTSVYTLPLGGLLIALFAGWVIRKDLFSDELTNHHTLNSSINKVYAVVLFILRFIAPAVVAMIFLNLLGVL